MKNKIIQFVGINGSGKTYLLSNYLKVFNPKGIEIVEFGQKIKQNMKEYDYKQDIDYYVNKLIDEILMQKKPTVIASHLVHKKGEHYEWDFKYDKKVHAIAYIHIITDPSQIYEQRLSDNKAEKKIREETTIESIAEHQEVSLTKTIEIAKELSSDLLLIYNQPGNLERNIMTMNTFFKHYFKESYKKGYLHKRKNNGEN